MEKFEYLSKSKLNDLPKTIGVYVFKGGADLIYIGKAINIRDRVKNHFQQPSYRDNLFINKVNRIGYLETNSEIEALILEASLIKKHQPKYNVVWRDDKNYFYVAIAQNKSKVPHVFITHQPSDIQNVRSDTLYKKRENIYIGPFVEGLALKKTLRFLRRAFPYYTNKKHSQNKCTYCHLGLCPGPVRNHARAGAPEGLGRAISNGAGPYLNLPAYRKNIKELALILKGKRGAVLNSLKKEMKSFSKESKFEEAAKIRDRISNLQQVMSHTNVINNGGKEIVGNLSTDKNTSFLTKVIGLKKPINRIECYDVSNIQGKFATGSMVVFIDGKPAKSEYKKFKIQTKSEPKDIVMLKELLNRRLSHSEWDYPDVMLIDGGKAQLNVAIEAKNHKNKTLHSKTPSHITSHTFRVISIAKGKQELFVERPEGCPQNPIPLKNLPQEVYNLIKLLDGEAHRFANTYHKKLRRDNLLN